MNQKNQLQKKNDEETPTENQFSETDEKPKILKQEPQPIISKLNKNFFERTKTTIYMLVGFIIILGLGHFYVTILVMVILIGILNEISNIKRHVEKQNKIPLTPILTWFIFFTGVYFMLGKLLLLKLPAFVLTNSVLHFFIKYHNFISFALWIVAFLTFVLSLKQGFMKYQFRVFGWSCLATLLIIFPVGGILLNMYSGLCWMVIPCLLVICNDIFAYLVGYFFGQTKLIELSPKKTWEGYIGGAFFTLLLSLVLTYLVEQIPSLVCAQMSFDYTPFKHPVCTSFLLQRISINFHFFIVHPTLLQLHTLVLSLFASLVGPFGGFFASGLKRSIGIKDFSDFIPGHGGLTDRMDCQLMMGAFAFFYLHYIVLDIHYNYSQFLNSFTPLQRIQLYKTLHQMVLQDNLI